jgi:hypothetical protein
MSEPVDERKRAFGETGSKYLWVGVLWPSCAPSYFPSPDMACSSGVSVVLRGCAVSVLPLAHVGVCHLVLKSTRSYPQTAIWNLEFPAPVRGALLPLALAPSARAFSTQPLPFAPPRAFRPPGTWARG